MKTKIAKSTKGNSLKFPLRIKSILVPLDFSTPSKKALRYATAVAQQFKAKLILLHVVEPFPAADFDASFPLAVRDDTLIDVAKTELERWVNRARIPGGVVDKILVRLGRSFHEITETADAYNVDLIIISTHGYTGLKHVLLGSTTERVVRHARRPVLVVRL